MLEGEYEEVKSDVSLSEDENTTLTLSSSFYSLHDLTPENDLGQWPRTSIDLMCSLFPSSRHWRHHY